MISASKYQHITCFMSLLKVSLCINRPKQRLLGMDTRRGCRSKRSPPPPGRTKTFFFAVWGAFLLLFFHGGGFILRFSCYEGLFYCMEAFLLLFLYVGTFLLRLSPGVGLFSQCGGLFGSFFLYVGGLFCLHGGFYVFMVFFMGLLLPSMIFLRRMLLCNFDPMSSAITDSGHYVPNKAHCNTRVQLTITMK